MSFFCFHLSFAFIFDDVCSLQTDGATIKSISENIVVNPGEEAKLSCAVDGKFVGKAFAFFFFCHRSALLCFDGIFFLFLTTFHGINHCNGNVLAILG